MMYEKHAVASIALEVMSLYLKPNHFVNLNQNNEQYHI